MEELNRAQRRAAERASVRAKKTSDDGIQLALSADEARLLEEALDTYRRGIQEDMGGMEEFNEQQKWAYLRAEQIRRFLAAAVAGYTYQPPVAYRHEPGGLVARRQGGNVKIKTQ